MNDEELNKMLDDTLGELSFEGQILHDTPAEPIPQDNPQDNPSESIQVIPINDDTNDDTSDESDSLSLYDDEYYVEGSTLSSTLILIGVCVCAFTVSLFV